jgi:hypothetical protein
MISTRSHSRYGGTVRMPPLLHSHHHRRRLLSEGAPVEQSFLLQRVQPALSGLMDGSLSTLAPIFAVVLATHTPLTAFFTGLATALGAGREHGVLRRPVRHR